MGAIAEPTKPHGDARAVGLAALGVVLLALLPSVGTIDAPWIAEDAAILARVDSEGPWADWTRSQFGMRLLRFWRPLVSTSWGLQEAWTGIAPVPLRLFNLALHALAAALVFDCARRLGAGSAGAFLAGAWIALFPEQGGTCTWLAGRTDLLCAFFLLASTRAALGSRPLASAPLAFLACAAKEFGFLAPAWIAVLSLARGERRREVLRRAWPSALAVAAAFAWRRAALGRFAGGYEAQLPILSTGLIRAAEAAARSAWPSLLALAALVAAGLCARGADRRALAGSFGAALAGTTLLYPLLADGFLEPENRRLFYVPECALALAAGLSWSRSAASSSWSRALGALAIAVLAWRFLMAWNDTHDWTRSALEGEQEVARARAAVVAAEPSERAVLFAGFPVSRGGAYCLGFGVAARFRAPFPETPRPVWPWRLVFVPQAERERSPLVSPHADGSIWPLDDSPLVPELAVRAEDGRPVARMELDERALPSAEDRSPRLAVAGGPAGARLEVVLYTELGYEPVPLGALSAGGAATFSLMALLARTNGVATAGQVLAQAADLGARRAYLELRALADDGRVLAASGWIALGWSSDLLERALSAR